MKATAEEFAQQYGLKYRHGQYQGNCPVCGYQGFHLTETVEKLLFKAHACGCTQWDLIQQFREDGLWGGSFTEHSRPRLTSAQEASSQTDKTRAFAVRLWERSLNAQGTPVETYLRTRGYQGKLPAFIRYVPNALHTPSQRHFPLMLAGVWRCPDEGIVAVHRTFLAPDGAAKASVEPNKMSLGPIAGGSVQLFPTEGKLAVTEGLETALSIVEATKIPTWAALSAGGIRQLVLPILPLAQEVIICADHDPVGLAAAKEAAYRWSKEGRQVWLAKPPQANSDFNDLLQGENDVHF